MKTSGLFTVHEYEVDLKSLGEPLKIVFFGDVHRDSPNFAHGEWTHFLAHAKSLKNAVFLGMGDYIDSASTSERRSMATAGFHESTTSDLASLAHKKVASLAKELSFMKGRLIGLINGNHYFDYADGTNSDNELAKLLKTTYLGVSSFIRLTLANRGRRSTLDIWAHHGAGGGRTLGMSINRVDQMREHAEADVYVMGHDHKRCIVPASPRLFLDRSYKGGRPDIRHRQAWLVRSGSFLASYEPGVSNYNVDSGRGPCSLGHVELHVKVSEVKRRNVMSFRGVA